MEIKYLEVLVMPNNEVLYEGKTLGFVGTSIKEKYLKDVKDVTEDKKIEVTLTQEELEDLQQGGDFNWNIDGVKVHIISKEQE